MMLTTSEIAKYLDNFERELFRLEVLPSYDVPADGEDVARFLRGESAPTPERKQPWLDRLARDREAGLVRRRVHVLRTPLSDYLRYECAWGYVPNAQAGEEIRILNLAEQRKAPLPMILAQDFWLVDGERVVVMHYDVLGRLMGGSFVTDGEVAERYRQTRDVAWAEAEPFESFWARHGHAARPGPTT